MSFFMSVCPSVHLSAWNASAPIGRIFMESDIWLFVENLPWKFKFFENWTRITCTLHEDQYTFSVASRSVLTMKKSQTGVIEKIETRFMFNKFFSPENRALYETTWKNFVEWGRPRLHGHASWLRYTCIAVLLNIIVHLTQLCVFVGLNYCNLTVMHGLKKNVNFVPLCNA